MYNIIAQWRQHVLCSEVKEEITILPDKNNLELSKHFYIKCVIRCDYSNPI